MNKDKLWSPYIAGIGLGLTLLATFYVMGKGLGASSTFSLLSAVGVNAVFHDFASRLEYLVRYLGSDALLKDWILYEVIGLFIGALIGALLSRNFKIKLDRGEKMPGRTRVLTALTGGILVGFASRLARGCTSGLALTGGAQLAVGGWVFVIAMFVSGFIAAAFFRRLWS
ncbi:MAG: hypothetical protein A2X59_09540 [Nitrospirae bacterium GWC2_42_7]|nr:MAG: hypothetical protein A2X59_09540 [Nitrospirae bacterium GWC2_42_7]